MTKEYLRELRHDGTVQEIARMKFPFPNEEFPNLETIVNEPSPRISVGNANGRELYPDIVVVTKPGQFLRIMAEVETPETLTDEEAVSEWKPFSEVGDLYLYVPQGYVAETKALLKKHKIHAKGIRTWRFRPVWGLEVSDAV